MTTGCRIAHICHARLGVLMSCLLLASCQHTADPVQGDSVEQLPIPTEAGWDTTQAYSSYLDTASFADRLFPDYVVCFRVPVDSEWRLLPTTTRARKALYGHRHDSAVKPVRDYYSSTGRELCFVSGWMSNRAAGYGHEQPWEWARELLMQYHVQQ